MIYITVEQRINEYAMYTRIWVGFYLIMWKTCAFVVIFIIDLNDEERCFHLTAWISCAYQRERYPVWAGNFLTGDFLEVRSCLNLMRVSERDITRNFPTRDFLEAEFFILKNCLNFMRVSERERPSVWLCAGNFPMATGDFLEAENAWLLTNLQWEFPDTRMRFKPVRWKPTCTRGTQRDLIFFLNYFQKFLI